MRVLTGALLVLLLSSSCKQAPGTGAGTDGGAKTRTLILGAYTTPREAYGKAVIPAFQKMWKAKTGEHIEFQESYLGSGAQARAIVGGFEADVAALSLQADIETIGKEGLIERDWKAVPHAGIVSHSIVVIGVRPGNPKGIKDWDDLAKPGISVLTPNVRTSGGAMWNVLAIYGAALRGHTAAKAGDPAAAITFLGSILANVKVMDRGARDSMLSFERGVGDAIITYENEVLVAQHKGEKYEYVIPKSTILIENPVAVVDSHAARHGVTDVADAFVAFLFTPEAQEAFAQHGLRSVDAAVAQKTAAGFPAVTDLFTVRDLGDWPGVQKDVFAPDAAYDQAISRKR